MAIISKIGSKSLKVRSLFFGMYLFLTIGSVTMVYPFLLMISGSTKSAVDIQYFDAIPKFLTSDLWLYRKHVEGLYNDTLTYMTAAYDSDDVSFEKVLPPGLDEMVSTRLQEAALALAEVPNVSALEQRQAVLTIALRDAPQEEHARINEELADIAAQLDSLDDVIAEVQLKLDAIGAPESPFPSAPDAVNPHIIVPDAYAQLYRMADPRELNVPPPDEIVEAMARYWHAEEHVDELLADAAFEFVESADLPPYYHTIGYFETPISKTIAMNLRGFKNWLRDTYGAEIGEVNDALGTEFTEWNWVNVAAEQYLQRREKPRVSDFQDALDAFKETVDPGLHYYFSAEGYFKKFFLKTQYGTEIEDYNEAHGTDYASWKDVHLSRTLPENEAEAKDWMRFVYDTVGIQYIRIDEAAVDQYRAFLEARHLRIDNLNRLYGTDYASFDEIPIVTDPPFDGMQATDWESFIVGYKDPISEQTFQVDAEHIRLQTLETLYQDHLLEKHGSLSAINAALGADYQRLADAKFPQKQMHYAYFVEKRGDLKWEFSTRNYKTVAEYMLFHGRGIFNTVVYCTLAILSALLVNPLAAYAMSRYKMPSSYKILLFMLCTMAFPPMVTSIPNFLMLRHFGLLNTFAALILPGLANGYAIFLLKGFFDAQPQELYESAQLDGANEWVLFWQIAMSLSKPILAVIALQAFNAAYSNFMFAFVVCQDEKMWTLMVWLYQLQQRMGQPVMYASLIIAALPTFLIFLFCQNIIMRGIVVPSEK